MDEAMLSADNAYESSRSLLLSFTVIGFLSSMVFGFFLSRSITRPLNKVTDVALAITEGDLSLEIDIQQKDELGQLAEAFRAMSDSLKTKAEAAEQIAEGNVDSQFSAVSEQASSLEETTSSIMEVASQTKKNADNASQANELASVARANVENGNERM